MQDLATDEPHAAALDAARRGDERAFAVLTDPYRRALHAHCYRMLASAHDADDALQETLLRAWRGLRGLDQVRALRPWLYRIATNVCLDAIARRPKRGLPADFGPPRPAGAGPGTPVGTTVWIEPYPDDGLDDRGPGPAARTEERESIELAFVVALQHLSARQRAVLILREVLGYSAQEVAETLDTTVASVNSALQRARRAVAELRPDRSQLATLRALGDARVRALVERYVEAWESRSVDAMVRLLTEDVAFAMPPFPHWFAGRDDVIAFIAGTGTPPLRAVPTTANGQPAVAWYIAFDGSATYQPASLEVLTLRGEHIHRITAFASPEVFPRFGLPDHLD